jgi:Nucleotidyltransferase of unknown function (DUF6036)
MTRSSSPFHTDTALAEGLRKLFVELEGRLSLRQSLLVYLAGGMAVHLYTGQRVTNDVDAEFAARVLLPNDLMVEVIKEDGTPSLLYLDTNYNPMFSLLHENYQDDAIALELGLAYLSIRVLAPVDLAVSKIARFASNDREDIGALVRLGFTSAEAIAQRANEALETYIGNVAVVRLNLRDAVAIAREV